MFQAGRLLLSRPACSVRPLPRPSARRTVCSAAMQMLSPPELAAQRAVISIEDAFSIDQVNLYDRLGLDALKKLATEFYDRVYADTEDAHFRSVFANSPKAVAIKNNYEFMAQRLGGPPLYSQRKGHPALPRRHAPFDCSEATAERYMQHMDAALAAVPEIDEDSRRRLHAYFRHTCYFLLVAQELRESMQRQAAAAAAAGGGTTAAPTAEQKQAVVQQPLPPGHP
ncbi:hypothetical protein ABPG75_012175 [Micractinium tetrahymenae]